MSLLQKSFFGAWSNCFARKTQPRMENINIWFFLVMKTTSPLVLVVPEVIMVGPKAVSFDDQITDKRRLTNE